MIIPLVFLLCFTFSCQQGEEVAEEPVVDIEAEKAAVKAVFDDWLICLETEDIELFSKIIAPDDDMVVIATDAAEYFIGQEPFKESMQKQFDAFEKMEFSIKELSIKVHRSGEVAWLSSQLDVKVTAKDEILSLEGMRFTGVMEKRTGNWVIVQLHASVPVVGQVVEY
jgi:uncharacterized protein (TIGR02246 family)